MIKNYNSIDSKRNCIIIRDAKGKKDRVTLLSQKALYLLREYKQYRPNEWLFEDAKGGKYSTTSLRKISQRALEQSGIKKNVTLHSLRTVLLPICWNGGRICATYRRCWGTEVPERRKSIPT